MNNKIYSNPVSEYLALQVGCLLLLKSNDNEPRGKYYLNGKCRVTEIKSDIYKKKKQFLFGIIFPEKQDDIENESSNSSNKIYLLLTSNT